MRGTIRPCANSSWSSPICICRRLRRSARAGRVPAAPAGCSSTLARSRHAHVPRGGWRALAARRVRPRCARCRLARGGRGAGRGHAPRPPRCGSRRRCTSRDSTSVHLVSRGLLRLAPRGAAALARRLRAHLRRLGPGRCVPLGGGDFLLSATPGIAALRDSLSRRAALGARSARRLPQRRGAPRRCGACGAEIEMWLHEHAAERERAARAAPVPVTRCGSGAAARPGRAPAAAGADLAGRGGLRPRTSSGDGLAATLAQLCRRAAAASAGRCARGAQHAERRTELLPCAGWARRARRSAPLSGSSSAWIAPALAALARRRPRGALTLLAGEHAVSLDGSCASGDAAGARSGAPVAWWELLAVALTVVRRAAPAAAPRLWAAACIRCCGASTRRAACARARDLDLSLERLLPVGTPRGHRRRRPSCCCAHRAAGGCWSSATSMPTAPPARALMVRALRGWGFAAVDFLVPNRFEFGYGLTPEIVPLAAERGPDAHRDGGQRHLQQRRRRGGARARHRRADHRSSSARARSCRTPTSSSIPNLPGSRFGSRALAGVGVAFYVMAALQRRCWSERRPAAGRARGGASCSTWWPWARSPTSCRSMPTTACWSRRA